MNSSLKLAALVAAAVLFVSCKRPPAPVPHPPPVTIGHPHVANVTNWDEFPARLEAIAVVEVKARAAGFLQSIHFTDGAEVQAGDLLFVIDPRPYAAELQRVEAARQMADTRLDLARNDQKRAEALRTSKAVSDEELDTRTKAVREAAAALASAEASVAVARLNLSFTEIHAPIGGQIGRRLVTEGNIVQDGMPQSTLLAVIVSQGSIYAYFDVDERSFLKNHHQSALDRGDVRCELALAGEDGYPHVGHVDFYDNQVDQGTGTIRVRARFDNADRALSPGLFARVRIPAGPPVETLLVPDVAIGSDQSVRFVLVANATNVVEVRPVVLGRQNGSDRAVLHGLTPQDRVIVNGLMMARPGLPVTPIEATNSPAAAAGH